MKDCQGYLGFAGGGSEQLLSADDMQHILAIPIQKIQGLLELGLGSWFQYVFDRFALSLLVGLRLGRLFCIALGSRRVESHVYESTSVTCPSMYK